MLLVPYNQQGGLTAPQSQRQQAEDLVDQAAKGTLTREVLAAIGKGLLAALSVGTIAATSGTNRVMNGVGAIVSIGSAAVLIEQLQKQRQWQLLGLVERIHREELKEKVVEVLTERAMLAAGETLALSPSQLSAFDQPEPVANFAQPEPQEHYEAIEYEPVESTIERSTTSQFAPPPATFSSRRKPEFSSSPSQGELDPIVRKYGKTIASITDMHSANSKPRHLALLSVSQCGKTTTLGAISYALRDRYPDMRFIALDGKNSAFPDFYEETIYPGFLREFDPIKVEEFFDAVSDEVERRIKHRLYDEPRMFVVLDEWNGVRDAIQIYNDNGIKGSELVKKIDSTLNAIAFRGLEYGVHICMVLQEVNCDKIGFTRTGRAGVHFLALGRAGDKTMIDLMLESNQIMVSKVETDRLRTRFDKVWFSPDRHPKTPVIVDSRSYTAEALPNFSDLCSFAKEEDETEYAPPPPRTIAPVRRPQQPSHALALASVAPQQSEEIGLPEVRRYTHPSLPGVSIVEPELLEILAERPAFGVIVKKAVNQEGRVTSRDIQQMSHHNAALKSAEGKPFNAQQIQCIMRWLATNYPSSFSYEEKGAILEIKDPALFNVNF